MRLLELFAGTGSVGQAFSQYGWEVIGLDINPGHAIQSNILRWDYTVYPRNHFDCIHASPPCTQYSICRTSAKTPRDLEGADALVQRTLDILEYFQAAVFIIENPYTGLMKDRPLMAPLRDRMKTVCYCRYGMPYRKATSIWTNLDWTPRPMCTKADPCEHVLDGRHVTRAQTRNGWTTDQLYMLPQALCLELAAAASKMFSVPLCWSCFGRPLCPLRSAAESETTAPCESGGWFWALCATTPRGSSSCPRAREDTPSWPRVSAPSGGP